ncbi:hypothetical protein POTOM_021463 [Populus tomentosa]|uniref:Uncharacterized protein n=1 Tax=Populus tomentosa TaxID=118781 RepID=A0A8X8D0Y8_POPTO|nr:hypothetical protein POTOM_021463 [Populus tomentosa]
MKLFSPCMFLGWKGLIFIYLTNRQREIEELKDKAAANISSLISLGGSVGKDDIQKLQKLGEQAAMQES